MLQSLCAILTKSDLDPEVRAKLEAQRGELIALREELGLDDYSDKRVQGTAEGEVSTKNSSQDTDNALDAEVETTPTLDLDSIARSSFDRVNSSSAELNRVIAEMRADGENVETYIPTERTRITDALARAIANSKYANVKGGNRGILSYLDAAEMMQADPDYTRRILPCPTQSGTSPPEGASICFRSVLDPATIHKNKREGQACHLRILVLPERSLLVEESLSVSIFMCFFPSFVTNI